MKRESRAGVDEFLEERETELDQWEAGLERGAARMTDEQLVAQLVWTLEGILVGCEPFGFERLAAITRPALAVLCQVQCGERAVNGELARALIDVTEAIRWILRQVQETGGEGQERHEGLVERLERMAKAEGIRRETKKKRSEERV